MCNVLHEIKIVEWVATINAIISALKDDGFLLIVEPEMLVRGERIDGTGFLILAVDEMRKLFGLETMPATTRVKETTCVVLPKAHLNTIDHKNVVETIELLRANTLEKIRTTRSQEITKTNEVDLGRRSAFLSQLYINSVFALDALKQSRKNQP